MGGGGVGTEAKPRLLTTSNTNKDEILITFINHLIGYSAEI